MQNQDIILTQSRALIGDALLKLFQVGRTGPKCVADAKKLFHMHMYYECHILTKGEASFTIGNRSVRLRERQMLIIPPKQDHYPFDNLSMQKGAETRVFGLTLESTDGEICCYPYFLTALQRASCMPISLSDSLYGKLIAFLDGFNGRDGGLRAQCRRATEVYPLFYELLDAINGFGLSEYAEREARETDSTVMLDLMVNDPSFSLGDIAHVLAYSYRHTARKIKEIYGDTLSNVRREIMLLSAKALLVQRPEMRLASIARKSGFASTLAMIRAFRSTENMTPTEYRNKKLSEKNGGC